MDDTLRQQLFQQQKMVTMKQLTYSEPQGLSQLGVPEATPNYLVQSQFSSSYKCDYRYVKLYYDYAISSVYFADTPEPGFNASFLVKKELNDVQSIKYGNWDAIHFDTVNSIIEDLPRPFFFFEEIK